MSLIEWTDTLSVRVQEFDEHHKRLISMINQLEAALDAGQEQTVVDTVLTELANYTIYHFLGEEELLARHAYPGLAEHRHEHITLAEEVLRFREEACLHRDRIGSELLSFLRTWLRHHILETDMQYAAFLNERGVS